MERQSRHRAGTTGNEPVVDAGAAMLGTVAAIRPGRIAVVRLEDSEGRCYDTEIPAAMLDDAVRIGDEFDIQATRRKR